MAKRVDIETDKSTVNLVELLLLKIEELTEKVDRLESARLPECNSTKEMQLFTIEQTAEMLCVSTKTLYNYRKENLIRSLKIKGKVMFLKSDIQKYIQNNG